MNNKDQHIVPIDLLTKFLAGEATEEEKTLVEAWRAKSEENQKEFNGFEKLWINTGQSKESAEISLDTEWLRMQKVMDQGNKKQFSFIPILRIAAVLTGVIIATLVGLKQAQITSVKAVDVASSNISLPDGSVISLNANSRLTYAKGFGSEHRNVKLNGEGFFEVAKNSELPFIIEAANAHIQVVGTKFNVKAYKNQKEVKVTVTEGKVHFKGSKSDIPDVYLEAGQTGKLSAENDEIEKEETINLNDISWKTFELDFDNTSLGEVAQVLSNTYHVELEIDDNIRNCEITVHFSNTDLASVLKVLKSTLDLDITKQKDVIFITGKECAN